MTTAPPAPERDPMDDAAYTRSPSLAGESTTDLGAQRCDLKALATRLTQELDRLKEGGEWRERLAEQCGKTLAAEALVRELRAALEWVAPHAYAGGKTFGQIEPVKSALAKSVEGEKSRQPPAALVAVSHQTTRL